MKRLQWFLEGFFVTGLILLVIWLLASCVTPGVAVKDSVRCPEVPVVAACPADDYAVFVIEGTGVGVTGKDGVKRTAVMIPAGSFNGDSDAPPLLWSDFMKWVEQQQKLQNDKEGQKGKEAAPVQD